MTASVSLNQFICLRQPASDYLSQCYQLSSLLKDLIDELKAFPNSKPGLQLYNLTKDLEMLLESFQVGVEEAHDAIDLGINPRPTFLSLNVNQTQISNLLREAIKNLTQPMRQGKHCETMRSRRARDRRGLLGEAGNTSRRKVMVGAREHEALR